MRADMRLLLSLVVGVTAASPASAGNYSGEFRTHDPIAVFAGGGVPLVETVDAKAIASRSVVQRLKIVPGIAPTGCDSPAEPFTSRYRMPVVRSDLDNYQMPVLAGGLASHMPVIDPLGDSFDTGPSVASRVWLEPDRPVGECDHAGE